MKEIFEKIEGREWDRFGHGNVHIHIGTSKVFLGVDKDSNEALSYSLADLLANKSWCKAVWGEGDDVPYDEDWQYWSEVTFKLLQREGEKEAIEYIKKTMI